MHKDYGAHLYGDNIKPVRDNIAIPMASRVMASITIGELAREAGVTSRALRFYQSKGLLTPQRDGTCRVFSSQDRARLSLIQQGKRLGFTLGEIRAMLGARGRGGANLLPISRKQCAEQIDLLKNKRRDIERALAELRQIYRGMFKNNLTAAGDPAGKTT